VYIAFLVIRPRVCTISSSYHLTSYKHDRPIDGVVESRSTYCDFIFERRVCRAGEIHRHLVEVCFVRVMSLIKLRVWCNYFGNVKREVDCKQLPGRPSMCHADARSREDRGIKWLKSPEMCTLRWVVLTAPSSNSLIGEVCEHWTPRNITDYHNPRHKGHLIHYTDRGQSFLESILKWYKHMV